MLHARRATRHVMLYPFQVLLGSSKYTMIAYEFANTSRVIHIEDHERADVESWIGESRDR